MVEKTDIARGKEEIFHVLKRRQAVTLDASNSMHRMQNKILMIGCLDLTSIIKYWAKLVFCHSSDFKRNSIRDWFCQYGTPGKFTLYKVNK